MWLVCVSKLAQGLTRFAPYNHKILISIGDGEIRMKFEIEPTLRGSTDDELLQELRRCAAQLGKNTVTMAEFSKISKGHPTTITRRFGSWFKALELANLQSSRSPIGISERDLFDNLKNVWIYLNRQPKYNEIKKPLSKYSAGTYEKRFGSWSKALNQFINWANKDDDRHSNESSKPANSSLILSTQKHKRTRREISQRQRFRVLLNSGFRCHSCGASPIQSPGIELHVDHIIPWSKGGETVDENLSCKCSRCNLGKGNVFEH